MRPTMVLFLLLTACAAPQPRRVAAPAAQVAAPAPEAAQYGPPQKHRFGPGPRNAAEEMASTARPDEAARRQAYCHDFAANWHTSTAPTADFFAAMVVGTSPQYRSAYSNCMAAFGRTDIYLGR